MGLDFTKLDRLGFHFLYHYRVGDPDSPYYREEELYYSHNGAPLLKQSRVNWAEEGRLIFDALFVDVPTAVAIVTHFLATGERSPNVKWIRGRELRAAEAAIGQ